MKKFKSFILSCSVLIFCPTGSYAFSNAGFSFNNFSVHNIEVSVAGGYSWLYFDNRNSHLEITPYEFDNLHRSKTEGNGLWKVGIGYNLFGDSLCCRPFFNGLLLELNYYYTKATIKGHVYQYQFRQFDNYSFRIPLTSSRLMFDVKPSLFTYQAYTPYAIFGVGAAWTDVAYHETVTGIGVNPNSFVWLGKKENTKVAYELGLGISAGITRQLSANVEYLYTYLGNVSPSGTGSGGGINVASAPTFKIESNSLLLGVSWNF